MFASENMKTAFRDIMMFFKGHWPHIVIAIPAAVVFTVFHELAHCVAVWVQGGTVIDFVWLPSQGEWGHMQYSFPTGLRYSTTAVALAPYAFWLSCCLLAGVLALKPRPWPFWCASTIFVWLFIAPLADIANAVFPYILWDADNDFRNALGPDRLLFSALAVGCGAGLAIIGYFLCKRFYRDRAVGLAAYCVLVTMTAITVLAVSSFGLVF